MRRVVVTGLGMVSPLGNTLSASWKALLEGQSGIQSYVNDPVLKNDKPFNLALIKDFDYKKWRVPHAGSRLNSFLWSATAQAIKDWGGSIDSLDKDKAGICLGTLASSNTKLLEHIEEAKQSHYKNVNRLSMLQVLTNIPAATLNVQYGFKGPSLTVSTACASGLSAIIEAAKWIKLGQADFVIAGATEDVYNPLYLNSSLRLQAMSSKVYNLPSEASRPFDKGRSGFILGQGSGVVILESLEHALSRGSRIYSELVGYGYTSDGYHLVRPEGTGSGQIKAMEGALRMAGVSGRQVDLVNAHATSTETGDEIEARAILKVVGERAAVSAIKGAIGHTFAAAGSIETIFGLMSMQEGVVPAILNLQEADIQGLNYVREVRKQNVEFLLKNSFGFGGINISALFRKWEPDFYT